MSNNRKDRLLERAAEAQRQNGMVPEMRAIDALWSQQLEEADRRAIEEKPVPVDERGLRKRVTAKDLVEESGGQVLTPDEVERFKKTRKRRGKKTITALNAIKRLKMLKEFPEWSDRVLKAQSIGVARAVKNSQERARLGLGEMRINFEGQEVAPMEFFIWEEVIKVLDASNAFFGHDWRTPYELSRSFSG